LKKALLQEQLDSAWVTTRSKTSHLYVLIDSTKHKDLIEQFLFEEPEYISLFDTSSDFELEKISPYIIKVEHETKFKEWLLAEWGENQSGFFFYSECDQLEELYQHFLTFTEIKKIDSDSSFFFNFYNPISLMLWLNAMPLLSRLEFFKVIENIIVESEIINQIKVIELDAAGFLVISEVLEDNSTEEIKCYQNPMQRVTTRKTEQSLPWQLSEEESVAIHKVSRYVFMVDITRKMWAYPSIREKHSYKSLWVKIQGWTEKLYEKNIKRKDDLAHFLILLAKYQDEWIEHANEINVILLDLDEMSRIKYLKIRDIVVSKAETSNG